MSMDDEEQKQLGRRLQRMRQRTGLTQSDAESEADLPDGALSKIENGTRSVDSMELKRLADLYQTSMDELMTGRDEAASDKLATGQRPLLDVRRPYFDEHEVVGLGPLTGRFSSDNLPIVTIVGPSRSGVTTAGLAVPARMGLPVLDVGYEMLSSPYASNGFETLRDVADAISPCVLFFDDVEVLHEQTGSQTHLQNLSDYIRGRPDIGLIVGTHDPDYAEEHNERELVRLTQPDRLHRLLLLKAYAKATNYDLDQLTVAEIDEAIRAARGLGPGGIGSALRNLDRRKPSLTPLTSAFREQNGPDYRHDHTSFDGLELFQSTNLPNTKTNDEASFDELALSLSNTISDLDTRDIAALPARDRDASVAEILRAYRGRSGRGEALLEHLARRYDLDESTRKCIRTIHERSDTPIGTIVLDYGVVGPGELIEAIRAINNDETINRRNEQ